MLPSVLGIRLLLLMGNFVPRPVPANLVNAVQSVEVTDSESTERGFRLTFHLNKTRRLDYPLLKSPLLEPLTRIIVAVVIGAKVEVLIDGILDRYQASPGRGEGDGILTVFGKDLTTLMSLEHRQQSFENQSSSSIVSQILLNYIEYGVETSITPTTDQVSIAERVPHQTGSDLELIQKLGNQHGFIFSLEPTNIGKTKAYWMPKGFAIGQPLPALTTNFGDQDNVRSLQFDHNTLAPLSAQAKVLDAASGETVTVATEEFADILTAQLADPTPAQRRAIIQDVPQIAEEALREVRAAQTSAAEPVTVNGELDTLRYGHVLRTHRTIGVRGAGISFDGNYRVQQVTHRISQGQYTQSFSLSRKGLGPLQPTVRV